MCEISHDCACQSAAVNTYRQLRARGVSDLRAFNAAAVVLQFHNPGVARAENRSQLSEWLDSETNVDVKVA